MRRLATIALAAGLAWPACAWALDPISGAARAAGPATLAVKGSRIRLAGLDPDLAIPACAGQADRCAAAAEAALTSLVGTSDVTCAPEQRVGHGSFLGTCALADGTDLGERLARAGWGVPDASASPAVSEAAKAAEAAKAGLWAIAP